MDNMKPLISVVVPIYNVEDYLEICIESIIKQTYDRIEIWLIDDGSTDRCPEICDSYEAKDERIHVVHKDNGGLSDARNVGINNSNGEYITFVDSDDYIYPYFLEHVINNMIKNEAEIGICDYVSGAENVEKTEIEKSAFIPTLLYNKDECLKELYLCRKHGMEFVAWGKVYKTSFFMEGNILYPVGRLHEDTFTTYKLIDLANKICWCDYEGYFYRVRQGSIMNSIFNEKKMYDGLSAMKEACDYFVEKKENEIIPYAVNCYLKRLIELIKFMKKNGKEISENNKDTLITSFKIDYKKYKKYGFLSMKHKAYYFLWNICLDIIRK